MISTEALALTGDPSDSSPPPPPPSQKPAERAAILDISPRNPLRLLRSRLRMMCGEPMSQCWGLDRGLPAHRHYINLFMAEWAGDITGDCLEFQELTYVTQFGQPGITTRDVLHLDESNPQATVIADITQPNDIPDNRYDCIVCTHVLHMIFDLNAAVNGLHRILKPNGVLLVAVPKSGMDDEKYGEMWRFTRLGLHTLLARQFGETNVVTKAYGNSIVAAGELRGMVADEFTPTELNTHDPRFAVEVCGRAVKVESNGSI